MSERSPLAAVQTFAVATWAKTRALVGGWSKPQRVLAAATTAAVVLLAGWISIQASTERWGVLFTQLEGDDAGAIVQKLKELKIPYRIENGGMVEVPEARVAEVRLELAGAGLPRGGGVGFESLEKTRLGATELEQQLAFRRALEGELARTIATVAAVQSARVHLVLPERSVFVSRREQASASVIVRARPGRSLGASEVAAVVHLVASAVPGLNADRVALVTTEGVTLHRPRGADGDAGAGLDAAPERALEAAIEERVRGMLARTIGAGHADVRVSAEMDLAKVERTEDHYDPQRATVRSEEITVERTAADDGVAGVPGAQSNLPGEDGATEDRKGGVVVRESKTRNFEIDHVVEKRTTGGATLRRLGVAVVLDGVGGAPRERAELDKIALLVRSAAGVDEKRGDVLSVESMPFPSDVEAPPPPVEPWLMKQGKAHPKIALGALGGVLLLALGAAVLVFRRTKPVPVGVPEPATETLALASGPIAATPALPARDLRREAHERAAEDPATAALVVRRWLGAAVTEGERDAA